MRFPAILAMAFVLSFLLLPTKPGESKLYFDADMKFNPPEKVRLHYAQASFLGGTEIQFGTYQQVEGQILSIYDEVVVGNSGGVIEFNVEFQTYDAFGEELFSLPPDPNNPFGGGGGPPEGFRAPGAAPLNPGTLPTPGQLAAGQAAPPADAPLDPTSVDAIRAKIDQGWAMSQQRNSYRPSAAGFGQTGASPMQIGGGGGGDGGGGDGGGGGPGRGPAAGADDSGFQVSPILETELNYSIAQNGRLLNLSGLDIIGDIINPARNITVRQFWESSHFLTLPDGPVHVGESWKGPWFWTVPYVGKTVEIPMIYTLVGIQTMERFRVAVISYTGLRQFEMTTLDENLERRLESDIQGDLVCQGNILFDIDRGIVVAVGQGIAGRRFRALQGGFPLADGNGMQVALTLDRIDTHTPLGNRLDTEPIDTHKLQELQWATWVAIE